MVTLRSFEGKLTILHQAQCKLCLWEDHSKYKRHLKHIQCPHRVTYVFFWIIPSSSTIGNIIYFLQNDFSTWVERLLFPSNRNHSILLRWASNKLRRLDKLSCMVLRDHILPINGARIFHWKYGLHEVFSDVSKIPRKLLNALWKPASFSVELMQTLLNVLVLIFSGDDRIEKEKGPKCLNQTLKFYLESRRKREWFPEPPRHISIRKLLPDYMECDSASEWSSKQRVELYVWLSLLSDMLNMNREKKGALSIKNLKARCWSWVRAVGDKAVPLTSKLCAWRKYWALQSCNRNIL